MAILLGWMLACGGSTSGVSPVTATDASVTARDISQKYTANSIAADAGYKGKVVEVTGTVATIGREILGRPYVTFTEGSVQAVFEKEDEPKIAKLKGGDFVTVKCRCDGFLVHVQLSSCLVR